MSVSWLIAVIVGKSVQARTRQFTLADCLTTCKTDSKRLDNQETNANTRGGKLAAGSQCHAWTACLGGGVSPVISGQVPHRQKSVIERRIARSELAMIGTHIARAIPEVCRFSNCRNSGGPIVGYVANYAIILSGCKVWCEFIFFYAGAVGYRS